MEARAAARLAVPPRVAVREGETFDQVIARLDRAIIVCHLRAKRHLDRSWFWRRKADQIAARRRELWETMHEDARSHHRSSSSS